MKRSNHLVEFNIKSFAPFVLAGAASVATGQDALVKPSVVSGANVQILQQKQPKFTVQSTRKLLDAIRFVESGGMPNNGVGAKGDNGNALGPYQIWEIYWHDALEYDPSIGGSYADCAKKDYSEKIVLAYWNRYAQKGASFETLARIHNGGPNGYKKSATIAYWNKVKSRLAGS